METLLELKINYSKSPKVFANKYNSCLRRYDYNTKCREYVNNVDNILSEYYKKYGFRKFPVIFYNLIDENRKKECKICGKETLFRSFSKGYGIYCSAEHARSDYTRVSDTNRKIGTEKRNKKMKALLNDPVKGKEYREKISNKSKLYMNNPEEKQKRSDYLKKRILDGSWTPNITNTWTHRESSVDGIPFRSSFEALFYVYHHHFNKKLNIKFEKLRIKYDFEDKQRIYIVDFIDDDLKEVFEIKPSTLSWDMKNVAKRNALLKWCSTNKYSYYEITEVQLKEYLRKMEESQFTHDYIPAFKERYSKW